MPNDSSAFQMAAAGQVTSNVFYTSTGWVCCYIPAQTPLHSAIHYGPPQRRNPGLLDGRAGARCWCVVVRVQMLLWSRTTCLGLSAPFFGGRSWLKRPACYRARACLGVRWGSCAGAGLQHGVHVVEGANELVAGCVARAQNVAAAGTLLRLPFESLFEYLQVVQKNRLCHSLPCFPCCGLLTSC